MTSSMGARAGWLWAAVAVMACTLACTGSRPQPESAPMAAGSAAAASTAAGSRASAPLPVHVAPRTRGHVTAPVRARLTAAVVARTVTLHVYTVPPEPGVKLLFDGQPVTTDAAGVAVINTPYRLTGHTLKLVRPQWASDHGRVATGKQLRGGDQRDRIVGNFEPFAHACDGDRPDCRGECRNRQYQSYARSSPR